MKVRDLIEPVKQEMKIVFMTVTKENPKEAEVCECYRHSEGIIPYLDRTVLEWRVSGLSSIMQEITIVVTLLPATIEALGEDI